MIPRSAARTPGAFVALASRWTRLLRRGRAGAVILASLVALASAAGGSWPATASAASHGFKVYNLSGRDAQVAGASLVGSSSWDGRPANGELLKPGAGFQDWELNGPTFDNDYNRADVRYYIGRTTITATLTVPNVLLFQAPYSSCSTSDADVQCVANGTTITLLDPPGTVHDVRTPEQAALLNHLCNNAEVQASCTFYPTSQVAIDSPPHQHGRALENLSGETQDTIVKVKDKTGTSDTVGGEISGSVKILKIVELGLSVKYDHEWSTEHEFEQEVHVSCPPVTTCWVVVVSPLLRTTGRFVLKLGNTTWNLPEVSLDTPNPDGNGAFRVCTDRVKDKQLCPGAVASPPAVYTLPPEARDAKIAEPRLQASISGPSTVSAAAASAPLISAASTLLAAGDADFRVVVSSTQPENRAVYPLQNIRVADTVGGRPGRHWLIRRLMPGQTRTLSLRVTVPPGPHGDLCIAVKAAARHARGALGRDCVPVTGEHLPVGGLG